MFTKITSSDYILILINSIVFFGVIIINVVLRSFSYFEFVNIDGVQHVQVVKTYYEYFDLLTVLSLLAIIFMLVLTIIIIRKKQNQTLNRTIEFSKLFSIKGFDYINISNAITTEEKLIINSWNKNIKQILDLQERRDGYFNMMVHDLKMPIQLSKFNAELYELEYGENEYISKINNQSDKLQAAIERILTLEKIKYFEVAEFEAVELISLITNEVNALSHVTNVKINTKYDKLYVITDITMLQKIVANLVDNIGKYNVGNQVEIKIIDNKVVFINETDSAEEYTHDYQVEREYSSTGNGLGTQIISTYAEKLNLKMMVKLKSNKYYTEIDFGDNLEIDN